MGMSITILNADYSIPVPVIINFDKNSTNLLNLEFNNTTKVLSCRSFSSTSYDFAMTSEALSAVVTIPSYDAVPLHAICVGADVTGNAIVLYLDGSGQVRKFDKSGNVALVTNIVTFTGLKPNTVKGTPITVTHGVNGVTISYTGYSREFLYTELPMNTKTIGILCTGNAMTSYLFVN